MIIHLTDFDKKTYTQIANLSRMRPVPQPIVWENVAKQFLAKGLTCEACGVIDLMAQHYGKPLGRSLYERVLGMPMTQCGRGITHACTEASHPAIFTLRDQTPPIAMGNRVLFRCGCNVMIAQKDTAQIQTIGALSESPQIQPKSADPIERVPIVWIAVDHYILYAHGTNELCIVEIPEQIPQSDDLIPLRHAKIQFESQISNLCGPLRDGTFFVTLKSPIPVLSDICRLCAINIDEIRMGQAPALIKNHLLSNIEQTLRGDCCACEDGFLTCGGGMQNREVRRIEPDGSWNTRFVHEAPVIRIISTESGPVSLDQAGQAILWDGFKPIDDFTFDITQIPEVFTQNPEQTAYHLDWTHKHLYLTVTIPPQSTRMAALRASHSCCLTAEGAQQDAFVKQCYACNNTTVVMLANGEFYFWDMSFDCVAPMWQLSEVCADQKDWNDLLQTRSPAIEHDPRIRMLEA